VRLLLVSDLHFDINKGVVPPLVPADVLLLAGDVSQLNQSLTTHLARLCDQFPHVVYVTGNHEYYQSTFGAVHEALAALSARCPNLHWLNNQTVTIDGQRVVGSTLWYPRVPEAEIQAKRFTDFIWIGDMYQQWDEVATAAREFLERTVEADDIVVTHHAPSFQSVHPQYRRSPGNVFYVHSMGRLIYSAQPKLWVHGHMHSPVDYQMEATRVLANPYGYLKQQETAFFNPALVLTV